MFLWFVENSKRLLSQTLLSVLLLLFAMPAYAAQVTLAWGTVRDAEGYRIYSRQAGESYQYSNPTWTGTATQRTISNLADDTTYYFVARAYAGTVQSTNSNEVSYHTPAAVTDNSDSSSDNSDSSGDQYQPPSSDTHVNDGETGKIWMEAEEGDIFAPMVISGDDNASDGGYVCAPVGSVSGTQSSDSDSGRVEFPFEVTTAGDYVIWARVNAVDSSCDSFYVAMDTGSYSTWTMDHTAAGSWAWDAVSRRNTTTPLVYSLQAGVHVLTFATREAGAKIDRILITNALSYVPSDMGEPTGGAEISKTNWSLVSVDSEEPIGENGAAVNAFDDNAATFWHTEWLNSSPVHPHEIVIDLGQSCQLDGFTMLPRQDGSPNGRVIAYEFYVGNSSSQWSAPVASGSFANNISEKLVTFDATTGRYIRLVALSEANGNPWTSVAEIGVRGVTLNSNVAPDGIIDTPSKNMTIQAGSAVTFSGSATDPDGNTPLSYVWHFGEGSGIADYTAGTNPGSVVFNTPGTFTVTFTATDSKGMADPAPASRVITVEAATTDNSSDSDEPTGSTGGDEISKMDWSLVSVDSEELIGEDGSAVNAFDDNPATFWHTEWLNSSPVHPHEIVIDLGQSCQLDGFTMLPRQDGSPNGRVIDYKFYVGNSASQWSNPVASGSFANNTSEKLVTFGATTGRYIRLVAVSEANGNPWTSVAEIGVRGAGANAPADEPSDTNTDEPATSVAQISQTDWQLVSVDSEELVGNDGAADNAFDGNPATIWHTEWWNSSPVHPHELIIDLGATYSLQGLSVLPRQDGNPNGRIIDYAFYVSDSTNQWGNPVASGSFANTSSEQKVTFSAGVGRYIRLVALSAADNAPWTSVAELNVTGAKLP